VDGFNRLPHGGVEVGGVLFGARDPNNTIRVLAHGPLDCEYASGPSFTLSENDERALRKILDEAGRDEELSGMEVVGWYHSHTRTGVSLSEKDIRIFDRFFPEPWQIALVLRPANFDPTRAGFFFREADGSVHSESSYHEFTLHTARKPARTPLESAAAAAAIEEPRVAPAASPELQDETANTDARAVQAVPARHRWSRPPAAVWKLATVLLLIAGIAVGSALFTRDAEHHAAGGLSLRALDIDGQLRIDWNRAADAVRRARGAVLEIRDGDVNLHHKLDASQIRSGSVTYQRQSGDVLMRLAVNLGGDKTVSEVTRFLGAPVRNRVVAEPSEADRLAPEPQPTEPRAATQMQQQAREADRLERRLNEMAREARLLAAPRPVSGVAHRAAPEPEKRPRGASAPFELPAPPPQMASSPLPAIFVASQLAERAPVRPPPPAHARYDGPRSGKIIWTGKLSARGTIEITGKHASSGFVTGALPGEPVKVDVFPAELTPDGLRVFTADAKYASTAPEPPGAQNGWNRTVYLHSPKQAAEIKMIEAPGPDHGWDRLLLRA